MSQTPKRRTTAPPDLLGGIMEATPSELALLTRAYVAVLQMHHKGIPKKTTDPLERLSERLWDLDNDRERTAFIDYDEPPRAGAERLPNPDAAYIRSAIVSVARATLVKGLVTCVAMQRRAITGTPYVAPAGAELARLAAESPHVRWTEYAVVPEAEVEALFYQARENDQPEHKKTVETHDMVHHWRTVVIPAIRERYRNG